MKQASLFPANPKPKSRIEDPRLDITLNRHGGNAESNAAHQKIALSKENSRRKVYEYALSCGDRGVTTDEVAAHFDTTPNAISGRLTELKALQLLIPTKILRATRSGCSARVFVATRKEGTK